MEKRKYPKGKEIAKNFLSKLNGYINFELISQTDVCHIRFDNTEYYLYFKCITHEGNPYPLEHRRAQLPKRKSFDAIKDSEIPFLFWGYDVDNDVYVCWEPSKVKPRLNKKTYVSFYSRLSIQESVVEGEIRDETLTNGDKFVLFKSADILSFFQMIDQHFLELKKDSDKSLLSDNTITTSTNNDVIGKLFDIRDDDSVKLLVDSMKDKTKLTIMAACMNEFGEYYFKMTLSDWSKAIKKYSDSNNN